VLEAIACAHCSEWQENGDERKGLTQERNAEISRSFVHKRAAPYVLSTTLWGKRGISAWNLSSIWGAIYCERMLLWRAKIGSLEVIRWILGNTVPLYQFWKYYFVIDFCDNFNRRQIYKEYILKKMMKKKNKKQTKQKHP